jgi:hypothetical protein
MRKSYLAQATWPKLPGPSYLVLTNSRAVQEIPIGEIPIGPL